MISKLKKFFIKFKIWMTSYRHKNVANYKYGILIHTIGELFKYINIFAKYKIKIERLPEKHNIGNGGTYILIELELWEICGAHDTTDWNAIEPADLNYYKWDKLERDIKKYGVVDYIEVYTCLQESLGVRGKMCRYCVGNGNHRLAVLKKLYDPTYRITVKLELDKHFHDWNYRLIKKNINIEGIEYEYKR